MNVENALQSKMTVFRFELVNYDFRVICSISERIFLHVVHAVITFEVIMTKNEFPTKCTSWNFMLEKLIEQ